MVLKDLLLAVGGGMRSMFMRLLERRITAVVNGVASLIHVLGVEVRGLLMSPPAPPLREGWKEFLTLAEAFVWKCDQYHQLVLP